MLRELTTDLEMLERFAQPSGKDVVDIGCGGGALVRELTGWGARVTGVEISESQLANAVARDPDGHARYLIGRAEQLPLDDASSDLVLFMRSLHHVPIPELMRALAEARRVLRCGGIAYVAEPLAEGDYFALVSLVEDEDEVRAAAQRALSEACAAGLRRETTVEYDVDVRIADIPTLRRRIVSVDPERAERFEARSASSPRPSPGSARPTATTAPGASWRRCAPTCCAWPTTSVLSLSGGAVQAQSASAAAIADSAGSCSDPRTATVSRRSGARQSTAKNGQQPRSTATSSSTSAPGTSDPTSTMSRRASRATTAELRPTAR